MKLGARALAFVVVAAVPAVVAAGGASVDHVCAPDEGKGVCPIGRVRSCTSTGALAACTCPPGAIAKGTAACSADPSAPRPAACVVPATGLGDALAAMLEFGELEVPRLPSIASSRDALTVASLDPKAQTASADELVRLALAHEGLEGEAAAESSTLTGARRKAALARRDNAVTRAIAVREALRARFPNDARVPEQSVALARARLRRRAYGASPPTVADGASAKRLLEEVVAAKAPGRPLRDAAFALAEDAVRDRVWTRVVPLEAIVVQQATGAKLADDPAYLAAAHARLAQARFELADVLSARASLLDAIAAGAVCEPRAECVSALSAARSVLAATWATLGEPARAMTPVLSKGAMPRGERVRPLVKLSEIYAAAKGASCAAAAEEARGWAQIVR